MATCIDTELWLRFIEQEYLAGFVRDGGAALKFAVPLDPTVRSDILQRLPGTAKRLGYLPILINAAETKLYMMDEIFFRTAEQIPWRQLVRRVLAKLAADTGYNWADSTNAETPVYRQLAEENDVEPQVVLLDLKKEIGNHVFKQRVLSKDFRIAMTHFCLAELSGGQDGAVTIRVLVEWLTGRNRLVSAVKPYQIFRKINRTTARYLFESMVRWVRLAGYPGILIVLDAAQVTLARNSHDQNIFYTKAAVLDTYEVLRQFIDALDQLESCLIVVVPATTFLEDQSRGIGAYEALKFRVFDEVRDKRLVNPMASLLRLSRSSKSIGHGDR